MMGHYTIRAWVFLAILPSYLAITPKPLDWMTAVSLHFKLK